MLKKILFNFPIVLKTIIMKKKIYLPVAVFIIAIVLFTGCSKNDSSDDSENLNVKQNDYPIVLVHGFMGWGRDEMNGYHYWGGKGDIQEYLKSQGYETYTASVGPLSSNWDRAIELYYYIKGGQVDYGAVHSAKYGHARYGKFYEGLYPNWDGKSKIHLIGHSMGGPTPRFLIQLLENGDPQEMAFVPKTNDEAPTSDLFKGGKKGWVNSFTSICGCHNGTITADDGNILPFSQLKDFLYEVAVVAGVSTSENFYDFNLQQWGIEKKQGQSFDDYWEQVIKSRLWTTTDNSSYDLTITASREQNAYCSISPNVYYQTYTLDATVPGLGNSDIRLPQESMNPMLKITAARMGMTDRDLPLGYMEWRYNDGAIQKASAMYPIGQPYQDANTAKNASGRSKGIWYVNPIISGGPDHLSIVMPDKTISIDYLNDFYLNIAKTVHQYPK